MHQNRFLRFPDPQAKLKGVGWGRQQESEVERGKEGTGQEGIEGRVGEGTREEGQEGSDLLH